jgi:translation initiation factor IF-2
MADAAARQSKRIQQVVLLPRVAEATEWVLGCTCIIWTFPPLPSHLFALPSLSPSPSAPRRPPSPFLPHRSPLLPSHRAELSPTNPSTPPPPGNPRRSCFPPLLPLLATSKSGEGRLPPLSLPSFRYPGKGKTYSKRRALRPMSGRERGVLIGTIVRVARPNAGVLPLLPPAQTSIPEPPDFPCRAPPAAENSVDGLGMWVGWIDEGADRRCGRGGGGGGAGPGGPGGWAGLWWGRGAGGQRVPTGPICHTRVTLLGPATI